MMIPVTVRPEHRWKVTTACGGLEFVKGDVRWVPEALLAEVLSCEALMVVENVGAVEAVDGTPAVGGDEPKPNYSEMKFGDLKAIATERGIEIIGLNKAELIAKLEG